MFKKLTLAAAISGILLTAGCSKVPPAHYGKILSGEGYTEELYPVGKYFIAPWKDLVLLEGSVQTITIPMKVTMVERQDGPNDTVITVPGVDMNFTLALRYSIDPDEKIIQTMFNSLTIDPKTGVKALQVFNLYAKDIVFATFRSIVGEMTPEEAFANRELISKKFGEEAGKRLAKTPIKLQLALVRDIKLPMVIVQRIEATKDRELQQAQENEQQKIELIKMNNAITLEEKESQRKLVAAEGDAEANAALSEGLDSKVLALRELEIRKIYANAFAKRMAVPTKGDTVFLPFESLNTTGASVRMFDAK